MISHKKAELFRHHAGQELSPLAVAELRKHKEAAGIRANEEQFFASFIQVVIKENPAWSDEIEIAPELSAFLYAVRAGDVKPFGASSVAYAEAYREWKRRSNFRQEAPTGTEEVKDAYAIPSDYSNPNYWALTYDQMYDVNMVQVRWNLQERIAEIESHMSIFSDKMPKAEFDQFADTWKKATALYLRMTGEKWIPTIEKKEKRK